LREKREQTVWFGMVVVNIENVTLFVVDVVFVGGHGLSVCVSLCAGDECVLYLRVRSILTCFLGSFTQKIKDRVKAM